MNIEQEYVAQATARIPLFKWVKPNAGLGRCIVCGDSSKNRHKKRFNVYKKHQQYMVYCFNCNYSNNLIGYMKEYCPDLYTAYRIQSMRIWLENKPKKQDTVLPALMGHYIPKKGTLDLLPVQSNQLALDYVNSRKLPLERLFYSKDFSNTVSLFNPDLDVSKMRPEPRVVIPFYDKEGGLIALQGRSLNNTSIRYLTIKAHEGIKKIYGMDRLDPSKPHYVLEGALDSMFIENSIAVCDSNLTAYQHPNAIYIFDNQYRNIQIRQLINRACDKGFSVVIFPSSTKGKDINDMVLNGYNIQELIEKNTYSGLAAKLKLLESF